MNFLKNPILNVAVSITCSLVVVSCSVAAQDKVPDRIDLDSFPGTIVEEVVIPIPAEVFVVLDKVGETDWKSGIVHVKGDLRLQERGLLAMSFGSLIAEGFIAVQAESFGDIQKIGQRSLKLAEALNLEGAVKPHSLSVIDAAEDGEWDKVRSELDSTQQTVRDEMDLKRDQEISGLVSLGGWLRGTNVLTGFIVEDFTDDKAELLNQPGLVTHFREMIVGVNESLRKTPAMTEIETGLGRIDALLRENDKIGIGVVKQLHQITRGMLEQFYFEPGADKN
jgi:hypothetical protein